MRQLLTVAIAQQMAKMFDALQRETGKLRGTPRRKHKAKHERGMIRDRLRRARDISA